MKTRSNWVLALLAMTLSAFVFFVERHRGLRITGGGGASALFAPIPTDELVAMELSVSNQVISLQRTAPGLPWRLRLPVDAAADAARIAAFLRSLDRIQVGSYLGASELAAAGGPRAFGLDTEGGTRVSLTQRDGKAAILQIGSATLGGSRFYLQRVGDLGVFVVNRALLDALPATADEWRDRAVLVPSRDGFDRMELSGAVDFRVERDGSGNWRLKRPLDARADSERINTLIGLLEQLRVGRFLSDRPLADRETYGLQSPAVEVVLGRGAQDLVRLSFGALVTNNPAECYALRNATNLFTVPTRTLEPLSRPLAEYRDRRLLGDLSPATALEFSGLGAGVGYRVERTNALATNWWVTAPVRFPADPAVMDYFLRQFERFEIVDFTADIVTDLGRYGLKTPVRSYRLLNGTNLLAELQLGTPLPGRPTLLHARRTDESAVYGLPISVLGQLADAAGQLRDWRFATTEVARVLVRRGGLEGVLVRTNGGWNQPKGRMDSIAAGNLDLTLAGLAALRSDRFALTDPRQEQQLRSIYLLAESPLSFTVELFPGVGRGFTVWSLEIGGELGAARIALARFDDDPVPLRIQIPSILYRDLLRDLTW